jgi:hypothetical protein
MLKYQKANDICERMKSERSRNRPIEDEILNIKNQWAFEMNEFNFEEEIKNISNSNFIIQKYFYSIIQKLKYQSIC